DQAKGLVHHSRAWSDMRDWHSELHEQAATVVRDKATKKADGSVRIATAARREVRCFSERHGARPRENAYRESRARREPRRFPAGVCDQAPVKRPVTTRDSAAACLSLRPCSTR